MFGLIGKTKQNSHPFFQLESFLFFSSCSGEIFISAEISFESILLFMMRNDWVRVDGNFATKLLTPDRVRISLEAETCEICSKSEVRFSNFSLSLLVDISGIFLVFSFSQTFQLERSFFFIIFIQTSKHFKRGEKSALLSGHLGREWIRSNEVRSNRVVNGCLIVDVI